jgi:hypothetical protein
MATKNIELEVDFLGGQGSLTVAEETALSEFFKKRKMSSKQNSTDKKYTTSKRLKATV